ncbi:MAG: hypothetical protein ACYSWW_10840 [Planctomycetota bacterium]
MENSSVVIIAKDFNLSIFKPLWLMKNNIFREEELKGDIVITPLAVQIPLKNFQFMVLPDRLQIAIPRQYPDAQSDINRVLGGIVTTLPHTPFTAVGLNFHYLVAPESEDAFTSWERALFASPFSNRLHVAEEGNTRFGSYLSFNVLGSRLKMDIKPINAGDKIQGICNSWHPGQDLTRVHFNFHTDVTNAATPAESTLDSLGKWAEASTLSQELRDKICELNRSKA